MDKTKRHGYWHFFGKELEIEQEKTGIKYLKKTDDYVGQKNIVLACTQQPNISQTEQTKIVNEWCDFFKNNQLPLEKIWVTTRISQKIIDAICFQTQLKGLWIKWGVYDNINGLEKLENIEYLKLGGGASLENVESVVKLKNLKTLETNNLFKINDYSFLQTLNRLVDLSIEGDPFSSMKKATLKSLDFLNSMPQLIRLRLTMTKIEDHSYEPILNLPNLKYLDLPRDKDLEKDIHKFEKFLNE